MDWIAMSAAAVLALAALLAGFMELGFRLGRRARARDGATAEGGLGVIEGAVFALLGLLIAKLLSLDSQICLTDGGDSNLRAWHNRLNCIYRYGLRQRLRIGKPKFASASKFDSEIESTAHNRQRNRENYRNSGYGVPDLATAYKVEGALS